MITINDIINNSLHDVTDKIYATLLLMILTIIAEKNYEKANDGSYRIPLHLIREFEHLYVELSINPKDPNDVDMLSPIPTCNIKLHDACLEVQSAVLAYLAMEYFSIMDL